MQSSTDKSARSILRFLLFIFVLSGSAHAAELMLAPGITTEGQATANISLSFAWDKRWFESETGHLGGYWNVAYTWWEAGRFGSDEQSVSISPVFIYHFNADGWRPFVEAGIGAAYFSDELVGDRRMGSRAQFADRLGVGVQLSDRDALRLRVIHYSNAGLEDPNDGINSWAVVYSRKF